MSLQIFCSMSPSCGAFLFTSLLDSGDCVTCHSSSNGNVIVMRYMIPKDTIC